MSYWMAGATIGGAALGFLGNNDSNDTARDIAADANKLSDAQYQQYLAAMKDAGKPAWADQQLPYVFGGDAWNPQMPTMNPRARDWGDALSAGRLPGTNKAVGPIGMDDLLSQIQGGGGQLNSLLGYGGYTPPPLWDTQTQPLTELPSPAPAAPVEPQPQAQQPPPWLELMTNGGMGMPGQPLTIRESDWTRKQTMPWHNAALLPNMIGGME